MITPPVMTALVGPRDNRRHAFNNPRTVSVARRHETLVTTALANNRNKREKFHNRISLRNALQMYYYLFITGLYFAFV